MAPAIRTASSRRRHRRRIALGTSAQASVSHAAKTTLKCFVRDSAHHAKTYTASASLYCTVTKVVNPNTNVPGCCEGVIATIGGSMLLSISTQNLASNAANSLYPITGGTGRYVRTTGALNSTNSGKSGSSNVVITIKG